MSEEQYVVDYITKMCESFCEKMQWPDCLCTDCFKDIEEKVKSKIEETKNININNILTKFDSVRFESKDFDSISKTCQSFVDDFLECKEYYKKEIKKLQKELMQFRLSIKKCKCIVAIKDTNPITDNYIKRIELLNLANMRYDEILMKLYLIDTRCQIEIVD